MLDFSPIRNAVVIVPCRCIIPMPPPSADNPISYRGTVSSFLYIRRNLKKIRILDLTDYYIRKYVLS